MGFDQRETVEYSRRSTLFGLAVFCVDVVILIGLIGLALCSTNIIAQTSVSIIMGASIAVLFVVGHDAGHQSLTPHRWLNEVIGRLALLPSLHPFSLWILVHNRTHHRWTNLSPKDYVWNPLSMEQYRKLSTLSRLQYQLYRSWAGPLFYYFFEFWIKRIMFPSRKEVRGTYKLVYIADILLVTVFAAGYTLFLLVGASSGWFGEHSVWNTLFFGALLPFVTWNGIMSFVIYLHHTHPDLTWYDDEQEWKQHSKQSEAAVHVVFPGPINLIFHWIMEHNAHHARPSIPLYNLKSAQRALADSGERIVKFHWTPWAHLDVVRRCKLYDYRAKRWMDYSGEYTSAAPRTTPNKPHFPMGSESNTGTQSQGTQDRRSAAAD